MAKKFKQHNHPGFWDIDIKLSKISSLGDPLEKLEKGVDFELFRETLDAGLTSNPKGHGGRPPYDYVLMFKILVLQRFYNLSDEQAEFQVNDRMSFMRFLGLTFADDIPDARTIWHFRERLVGLGLVDSLFTRFLGVLEGIGLVGNEGRIVDASFVEVPIQRNTREENAEIKKGETPESFKQDPNVLAQKDVDARWVQKNGQNYYGYKNHVKMDSSSKLLVSYTVTDASVHDSQVLGELLDERDRGLSLNADAAYVGDEIEALLAKMEMPNKVNEKGYAGHPLTEGQKENNREKSRTRARVEHAFAFMEMSMHGMYVYAIGKKRVTAMVGMMNLVYNMFRMTQLFAA